MDFSLDKILRRKKYQTGLALSGGGARGISHLGAIKALQEHGYTFDIISGTSIGAIVGCLICDGYTPDQVLAMLNPSRTKSFIKPNLSLSNLMKMEGARNFLNDVLRTKNIEDLSIPFIPVATNLIKGEAHCFQTGNIVDAVIASASIPVIFPPVEIDGERFVDGGVLHNLPVRPIRNCCRTVIGLHVNPEGLGMEDDDVKTMLQIAERSFYLAIRANVLEDQTQCDIFIEHSNLHEYKILNFERIKDIFDVGYTSTQTFLNEMNSKNK